MPNQVQFRTSSVPYLLVGLSLAVLAGCASLPAARMVLPESLVLADEIQVSGIGGGNLGAFSAGSFNGGFERDETRLAWGDSILERRRAMTRFWLSGPSTDGRLEVACQMHAEAVTFGLLHAETAPMDYVCEIESERSTPLGRLEVRAVPSRLRAGLSLHERQGQIELSGLVFQIRSEHALEGSTHRMAAPMGYLFEQGGQPIGAVSLNGAPLVTLRNGSDARTREAVLVASLALGLMRDPAESALGQDFD